MDKEKTNAYHFTINKTKESKYSVILLGQSGSLLTSNTHIAEQISKATFSLLRKIKRLKLPFVTLKLPLCKQIDICIKNIKLILYMDV